MVLIRILERSHGRRGTAPWVLEAKATGFQNEQKRLHKVTCPICLLGVRPNLTPNLKQSDGSTFICSYSHTLSANGLT